MPADRLHDVSGLTADQLDRARRDLQISLALASPGSPVHVLDPGRDDRHRHRASQTRRQPMIARDPLPDDAAPGNGNPGEGRADG